MKSNSAKTNVHNQPLITFVLFCYNQEAYIRDAIEGALSQTYSPLELIINDDCSTDASYEIISSYTHNNSAKLERIVARRNENNCGLAESLNKVMEIAKGELITLAAGDDISLSNRVEETYRVWKENKGRCYSIHGEMHTIDSTGMKKGLTKNQFSVIPGPASRSQMLDIVKNFRCVSGASQTIHRNLFDRFGPIDSEVINEDIVLAFRAALLGSIRYIPFPIGMYREHDLGISQLPRSALQMAKFYPKCRIPICRQMLKDIESIGYNDPLIIAKIKEMARKMQFSYDIHTTSDKNKLWYTLTALRQGVPLVYAAKQFIKSYLLHARN